MDSARDFCLLGESVPQVRVSAHTLALRGSFHFYLYWLPSSSGYIIYLFIYYYYYYYYYLLLLLLIIIIVIIINIIINITERRTTPAYYRYQNHTYTTTHAQPHILTTTHSAPPDKQTVRLAWLTDSQRTTDTGMNDLPSSQQPPTSDDTPARDTGVLRIHLS